MDDLRQAAHQYTGKDHTFQQMVSHPPLYPLTPERRARVCVCMLIFMYAIYKLLSVHDAMQPLEPHVPNRPDD
jgi:hypothetical protein